jgi:hypothetical protein
MKARKPKYKIGDMVYSYWGKGKGRVNYVHVSPLGYPHKYRLTYQGDDGYPRNSNWIDEESLSMKRKTSRNPVYLADVVDDSFSKHYAGNYASQGAASAHIAALREMGIAAGYEQKGKRHLVFTTMKVSPDKKSAAYKRFANPTTGDGKNLIDIMCQATMSAYAAHTRGRTVDSAKACEAMRRIIKTEWPEFKQVMKDALDSHMGDAMYRGLMNTYANAWAVKAIEDSGTSRITNNPTAGVVRRPQDGETLVCTRTVSGHDLIPGIAKGDRAVYLGKSQIRMMNGAAAGWVFTLEIGAPFNIVPNPVGNPAGELGKKSATDLHISKWFGRYVELMDASGNREVYVWAHLTPEEQRIITKNSRLPRNEWASAPSRFNIPPLNFPNPGRASNPIVAYRGWTVRKSGPDFLRVYDPRGYGTTPRVKSVEAGKALIDCSVENRVMTPQEHKLIYQNPVLRRNTTDIELTDVAKIARRILKQRYPRTTFSVRSSRYAGGSSIHVSWTDGPTEKAVNAAVGHLEGSEFDGMIDLKSRTGAPYQNDYIMFNRDYSDASMEKMASQLRAKYGIPQNVGLYDRLDMAVQEKIGHGYLGQAAAHELSGIALS